MNIWIYLYQKMMQIWYKWIFVSENIWIYQNYRHTLMHSFFPKYDLFWFWLQGTLIVCHDICFHILSWFVFIVTCNLPSSPSSPSTKRKAESRKKRTSWSPITHLYSAKKVSSNWLCFSLTFLHCVTHLYSGKVFSEIHHQSQTCSLTLVPILLWNCSYALKMVIEYFNFCGI